jgi:hypothetical protein
VLGSGRYERGAPGLHAGIVPAVILASAGLLTPIVVIIAALALLAILLRSA